MRIEQIPIKPGGDFRELPFAAALRELLGHQQYGYRGRNHRERKTHVELAGGCALTQLDITKTILTEDHSRTAQFGTYTQMSG
jgi:hypothetical protein